MIGTADVRNRKAAHLDLRADQHEVEFTSRSVRGKGRDGLAVGAAQPGRRQQLIQFLRPPERIEVTGDNNRFGRTHHQLLQIAQLQLPIAAAERQVDQKQAHSFQFQFDHQAFDASVEVVEALAMNPRCNQKGIGLVAQHRQMLMDRSLAVFALVDRVVPEGVSQVLRLIDPLAAPGAGIHLEQANHIGLLLHQEVRQLRQDAMVVAQITGAGEGQVEAGTAACGIADVIDDKSHDRYLRAQCNAHQQRCADCGTIAPNMNQPDKAQTSLADHIGPGLITGAADDDPSGIATYSQAGAQFGLQMLWTVVLTFPLMCAIQMVSARIGHVTRKGLTANIRLVFPQWVTLGVAGLLVAANSLNISADIAAMAEALRLLVGGSAQVYAVTFGLLCLVLQVFLLKWLTLALFTYVAVVFSLHIDWGEVALSVIWPHFELNQTALLMIVAVFGTTISPYLFFWQAGQEMENALERGDQPRSPAQIRAHLRYIKWDTISGMAVSNIVAFFIILCTAVTLHKAGMTQIQTAAEAAEALRPLAGRFTFVLFSLGIIGTGLLAVPVLAGSAAYAAAEAFGMRGSLSFRVERGEGRGFYAIIALATLGGVVLAFTPADPVDELFWAAVLNGVISVPIMAVMMLLAARKDVMGAYAVGGTLRSLGWLSTAVMMITVAALLFAS